MLKMSVRPQWQLGKNGEPCEPLSRLLELPLRDRADVALWSTTLDPKIG